MRERIKKKKLKLNEASSLEMYASQKCFVNGTSLSALHRIFPIFWQRKDISYHCSQKHLIAKERIAQA